MSPFLRSIVLVSGTLIVSLIGPAVRVSWASSRERAGCLMAARAAPRSD